MSSFTFDASGAPIPSAYVEQEANAAASSQNVSYFQGKVAEFQQMMYDLDTTAANLSSFIQDYNITDPALTDKLAEFDRRKFAFRAAAETLNFAVNGVNSFGANLPLVNIPAGLGALPVAALAAVASAVAVAAALIVWGREWIVGVNDRLKTDEVLQQIPLEQRGAAAAKVLEIEATAKSNEISPLASIASIVKWVAIGAGLYFAFKALDGHR